MTPAARKWSGILDDLEDSELGVRAFARARGLNPNTLAWWRWKLANTSSARPGGRAFVEVVPASASVRIEVRGGVVHVDQDSDLGLLRRVLEALA